MIRIDTVWLEVEPLDMLAACRLHQGKFVWPKEPGATLTLSRPQLDALALGLPWQHMGEAGIINVLSPRCAIAEYAEVLQRVARHDHSP